MTLMHHKENPLERVEVEKVLAIGLTPDQLETIDRAILSQPEKKLKLERLSPQLPDHQLLDAIQHTALVFVLWDGISSPHFMTLRRIRAQSNSLIGKVHIIYSPVLQQSGAMGQNQESIDPCTLLNAKQSLFIGVASWIRFPERFGEIEELIKNYNTSPTQDAVSATEKKSPRILPTQTSSHGNGPHSGSPPKNIKDSNAKNPTSPQRTKTPPSFVAPSCRLPPGIEIDARAIAEKIEHFVQIRAKSKQKIDQATQNPNDRPPFHRIAIFHPDSARANELTQAIQGIAAYFVDSISTVNGFLAAHQKDIQAAVIWFDGVLPEPGMLIRQIAENSSIPTIPTALLIPDQSIVQRVKNQLQDTIFDSVIIYNRMNHALNTSLKTLAENYNQTNSARALIDRLRRPFRSQSPPEYLKSTTLKDAENLAKRLIDQHGKEAWAALELIPYLIRDGHFTEAFQKLQKVNETWPDSFIVSKNVYQLSLAINQASKLQNQDEENTPPLSKLKNPDQYLNNILQRKDATPHRLMDLGQLALKNERIQDVEKILNAWQTRPKWLDEADFFYLAGNYLAYVNKDLTKIEPRQDPLQYFSKALMMDPERIDLMSAYAELLVKRFDIRYGLMILKQVIKSPLAPWHSKITLIQALKKDRQFKEARSLIEQFLQEAPGSKALQELGRDTLLAS